MSEHPAQPGDVHHQRPGVQRGVLKADLGEGIEQHQRQEAQQIETLH
ncbi:hypothetical protein [Pluralibacter gergoviae]|nr:hypothetical protein [Pluralibacter gergoviae]